MRISLFGTKLEEGAENVPTEKFHNLSPPSDWAIESLKV